MLFSQAIPEGVLEAPNTQGFVNVMDELHKLKTEEISRSLRVYNPALCTSTKWLAKRLSDYGVNEIPDNYPFAPLQQVLLNIELIRRLCGSKLGVEIMLSTFTLGLVSIDDGSFIRSIRLLYPDDLANGYATEDNSTEHFFLCDNNEVVTGGTTLGVTIYSVYFDTGKYPKEIGDTIKDFLKRFINHYVGFQDNLKINWVYRSAPRHYYHRMLNNYFTE